jgi:diguanylate cyclase (GGDEF)-like protein/PAS domain S-box-containing protein
MALSTSEDATHPPAEHRPVTVPSVNRDPLREIRALKRLVQIGVYAAILGTEPFYFFVLHYSWPQLLIGLTIGLIIATVAIEGAFGQMFKLRKRSAYPVVIHEELSFASDADAAIQHALPVLTSLLRAKSAFAILPAASDEFRLAAVHQMSSEAAENVLRYCYGDLTEIVSEKSASPCHAECRDLHIVFLPAVAFTKAYAVFAFCTSGRGSDLNDRELLEAIGLALGLSLHNLRQKEALVESEMRFRALIENSTDGIALVGPDGVIAYAAPSTERILGYKPEGLIGVNAFDLFHPEDVGEAREQMASLLDERNATRTSRLRLKRKDGVWRWVEGIATNLLFEPTVRAIVVNYRDITERRDAEEALKESEEQFRLIQENALDAIITMSPEGEITSWNPQAETVFGWTRDEVVGRPLAETLIPARHRESHVRGLESVLATGEGPILNRRTEVTALDRSGREFPVELAVVPLYRGEDLTFCAFVRDISERKKAEETIRHLAYHDVLTGLPNRVLFEERLRLALAQAKRSRTKVAVMFLDLDRFKLVNDTVGHTGGDQLLQEVAREFSETVREGDTVARVGGDEFTFLLPGIEHREDATTVAERILQRIRQPRSVAGQEFRVSTSIGITIFPRDGSSADILMRNADTAMYRAKERGRDNYQLFTPAMKASLQEMLSLENDLRRALEREELFILYQPLVAVDSGSIVGGEALLRWQHPRRGLVAPDEFIPLAEETGLISGIGEWVLHQACRQAKTWEEFGLGPIRISVNVAARQVEQPGLVGAVGAALADSGLPPHRLQLELTEGAVMRQVESVTSALAKLRAMGVGISIDDFGTGYSSLGYLKRFPIDTIKIDRSFVRDVTTDQNDAAIVTTVIAMARGLNLRVVAEGVETEAQLRFLRDNKCDEYQGFLLSPAVSPNEFEALVRQREERPARVVPIKFG